MNCLTAQYLNVFPVWITSSNDWHETPILDWWITYLMLVFDPVNCYFILVLFHSYFTLRADTSTCRCRSSIKFVVFTTAWSDWLSVKAWISGWYGLVVYIFSFTRLCMKTAVSHLSERVRVSVASVKWHSLQFVIVPGCSCWLLVFVTFED